MLDDDSVPLEPFALAVGLKPEELADLPDESIVELILDRCTTAAARKTALQSRVAELTTQLSQATTEHTALLATLHDSTAVPRCQAATTAADFNAAVLDGLVDKIEQQRTEQLATTYSPATLQALHAADQKIEKELQAIETAKEACESRLREFHALSKADPDFAASVQEYKRLTKQLKDKEWGLHQFSKAH